MSNRIPVIIDTDPAMGSPGQDIDDGFALIFAKNQPTLDVKLMTTVNGNVTVDYGTFVADSLRKRLGWDIPLAKGCSTALDGRRRHNASAPPSALPADILNQPAPDAIANTILQSVEPVTLICLGPLTNIAMSMLLYPRIIDNIRTISIMGGLFFGTQNSLSMPVEFNFWMDPHAADIVLNSPVDDIRCVGLDVTKQITLTQDDATLLEAGNGSTGATYAAECFNRFLADRLAKNPTCYLHDPLAVGAITHPGLIEWTRCDVEIVTEGRVEGMVLAERKPEGRILVATTVDATSFKQVLFQAIDII